MNPMQKFTAKNSGSNFTFGRSYYTADVQPTNWNEAFMCVISDDRGTRHNITTDVPSVRSNGVLIEFDVGEVSSGNV